MCTTLIITKGAMKDGSMVVTHSDDGPLEDNRLIKVPAMDHNKNSLRAVYGETYRYPRIVCKDRGKDYDLDGYPETKPIGYVPEVPHTYAYFDNIYGVMNEHNLMFGECTNYAKYEPSYVTHEMSRKTGKHIRLFYAQELSRIALERCKTAREAVLVMGEMIDTYGLFSYGETLLIADENEGWVFEMCALPDETYHSAWVAKKVPDGEVFVAANEFRIREIEKYSTNFMYSKLLEPGIYKLGWWQKSDGPIDWLKAVANPKVSRPYNTFRRIWRAFDLINPDLFLSPWVEDKYTRDYPFSIKPKNKLTLSKLFALYRDHYEGTQFDLTKGVAAGPYGDPTRFRGDFYYNDDKAGAFERPISIFYQSYTHVCQLRPKAPQNTKGIIWFSTDVAHTSLFIPFPTAMTDIPLPFRTGNPQKFDETSAFWIFNFVGNWARLNFQAMTKIDINPLQISLEHKLVKFIESYDKNPSAEDLTNVFTENTMKILSIWKNLARMLIAKYSNGYCNLENQEKPKDIGYSSTWLNYTNYKDGSTTFDIK